MQAWLARLEVSLSLSLPSDSLLALFTSATISLPYAGSLWSLYASHITSSSTAEECAKWYEESIATSLLTSAIAPTNFHQPSTLSPRTLLPSLYLSFLLSSFPPSSIGTKIESLLSGAPTLPIEFLRQVLDVPVSTIGSERRTKIVGRLLRNRDAGAGDWIRAAREELEGGKVVEANEVVLRAARALKGGEKVRLEKMWEKVCDGKE